VDAIGIRGSFIPGARSDHAHQYLLTSSTSDCENAHLSLTFLSKIPSFFQPDPTSSRTSLLREREKERERGGEKKRESERMVWTSASLSLAELRDDNICRLRFSSYLFLDLEERTNAPPCQPAGLRDACRQRGDFLRKPQLLRVVGREIRGDTIIAIRYEISHL